MFTEPKIVNAENLNERCYVTFRFNGKRYRFYNGNAIEVDLNPNKYKDASNRLKMLMNLSFELEKSLSNGWNPSKPKTQSNLIKEKSLADGLKDALGQKLRSPLSDTYKRDLQSIYNHFIGHLSDKERKMPISNVESGMLDKFLAQFNTSGTNYMNKRRALGVLFSVAETSGYLKSNPVLKCAKQKAKASLHKVYTDKQLRQVLDFLKSEYPNLYLCCLLGYGCLIRPHQEFRLLQRKHLMRI